MARPHLNRIGRPTASEDPRAQKKRRTAYRKHRFVEQYLALRAKGIEDHAAIRQAVVAVGFSKTNAAMQGKKLMADPLVKASLDKALSRHIERAEINGETIMRYWYEIAMSEIPWPHPGPCRNCWGQDHQYQYTLNEYRSAMRKHTSEQLKKQPHNRVPFDELGGIGFDRTKKPHPYCPECNGEGRNYQIVLDPQKLTEGQRQAIDEIRMHKDGSVSLKLRDRSRAMENLQQLMGLIQPRKPLEVIDPARPIEENVNIVIQTAVDQGLLTLQPLPVLEHDGHTEQLATTDAE